MSDLKHKISNKDYSRIDLNKHINTLVDQDSSIDSAMALLFTKILCINPDERIGLLDIIKELEEISETI